VKRLLPFVLSGGVLALAVATAVTASLTAPTGTRTSSGNSFSAGSGWASTALAVWSPFPVNARLRPLVLTGPVIDDPSSGFPDGAAKLAYIDGAIDPPGQWPAGPLSADAYPLRSAQESFRAFSSASTKAPLPAQRLPVVRVDLGTAVFGTDRGALTLPAWQFWLQGVHLPASVLAVAPERIFQPRLGSGLTSQISARLDSTDRRLTVFFFGAAPGTGPCTADYTVEASPSLTAVAIRPIEHFHYQALATVCSAVGYLRQASVALSSPLGVRVLVDAGNDAPIPVAIGS